MSKTKAIPQAIRAALAKEQGRAVRELRFERATVNTDARTVEICFATETPYERYWGVEILDCKPGSVRTQRLKSGCNLIMDRRPDGCAGDGHWLDWRINTRSRTKGWWQGL